MNILFLMGVYPSYGGVEKVSTVLSNEFVRRGHKVAIISFEQPHPELAASELTSSVRLYKLERPVSLAENRKRLHEIIRQFDADVLINQWCVPYYVTELCRRSMKGSRCRLISVHHNLPNTNARIQAVKMELKAGHNTLFNGIKLTMVRLVSRLSLRWSYTRSDVFVVLSPSFIPISKRYMWIGENEHKLQAIFNPITIKADNIDLLSKQKEIVYVGRIEYNQKRTFRLIEIWERLQPLFPDWKLTIVGDGPDRNDLEKRISTKGLKQISVEGFRNPAEYYAKAAILLLVSEYEGFGLVLTEGMMHGVVPVVLGSYAAVYDIVEHGVSGIIVSYPYSETKFVDEVKKLMDDSNMRETMAFNARKSASMFSLRVIADQWEELFKRIQS